MLLFKSSTKKPVIPVLFIGDSLYNSVSVFSNIFGSIKLLIEYIIFPSIKSLFEISKIEPLILILLFIIFKEPKYANQ